MTNAQVTLLLACAMDAWLSMSGTEPKSLKKRAEIKDAMVALLNLAGREGLK